VLRQASSDEDKCLALKITDVETKGGQRTLSITVFPNAFLKEKLGSYYTDGHYKDKEKELRPSRLSPSRPTFNFHTRRDGKK